MKKIFTLLLVTLMSVGAFAYDFEVDGIYYNFNYNLVADQILVEVTYKDENYNSYSGDVVIPEKVTYNGTTYSVCAIDMYAFRGSCGLMSVTIPKSVCSIGSGAFDECNDLMSIEVLHNGLFYSVDGVLFCKYDITLLRYPAGKKDKTYTIPNSVKNIGFHAFDNCITLTSVAIPNSVMTVGDYAFNGCSGLTSITIPNSVTTIGQYAFYECSGLTSITIPNSVTTIGSYAFDGCSGLTNIEVSEDNQNYSSLDGVLFNKDKTTLRRYPAGKKDESYTIPNSVTTIVGRAFSQCPLEKITCLAKSVPSVKNNTFDKYDATLYVPCDAIDDYKAHEVWGQFEMGDCIETAVENVTNDNNTFYTFNNRIYSSSNEEFKIYTISGIDVTQQNGALPKGVYIIKSNNKTCKVAL